MWVYVARRLLYTIPILFGVLFLTFAIFEAATDPSAVAKQNLSDKATETQVVMWLWQHGYGELSEQGNKKLADLAQKNSAEGREAQRLIDNAEAEAAAARKKQAEEDAKAKAKAEAEAAARGDEPEDPAIAAAAAAKAKKEAAAAKKAAAENAEAEKKKYTLNVEEDFIFDSAPVRFGRYVGELLTFDFGRTLEKRPVLSVMGSGIWPSLKLTIPAFILSELLGVFFALFAALYRNTKIDRALVIGSVLLMSISPVAFIIFAQKFIAADWQYLPVSGYSSGFAGIGYLLLPIFIYVVVRMGEYVRFNRILMLDEVGQDYVRTAKAKGVSQNSMLFKHVLRNAMIPLITRWVIAIPYLYLGSLLLEAFFGIPGLGYLTVKAVQDTDVNMVRALVFVGTLLYIFATLLADVLYALVDPRIKLE